MNERIKLLVEQAGYTKGHHDEYGRLTVMPEFNKEKFAELIVRGCANAIINDSRLNDVRSAANGCVRTINEHFGVEE